MSIFVDKKGHRRVSVMVGGRRVQRVLPKGATAGDAKRLEAEVRSALGRRSVTIPGDPPLAELMAGYIAHTATLRSPKTAQGHAYRIGQWLDGRRASEARHVAAGAVRDMTGHYAPATINRSLGALKKALRLAFDRGAIAVDYSASIKRLAENNARSTYLTPDEVGRIANCASEPVRAAIWIAVLTGLRRGEICKIAASDIGAESILIRAGNTKTLRTRTIPITAALRPWLPHLPLPINFEGVKSGFRRAREAAGLPHARFHDLRHSCASILINAGVPLEVVRDVLGHGTIKTTERYAHLQVDAQRAALEKLGEIATRIATRRAERPAKRG